MLQVPCAVRKPGDGPFWPVALFNNRSEPEQTSARSMRNDAVKPMENRMKNLAIASALVLGVALLPAGPANARGCIKGAVVGGTAGHFVGHHGFLGAAAGCLIGRHHANSQARMNRMNSQSGYGSSAVPQQAPVQRY
jgi:hypothetical protein